MKYSAHPNVDYSLDCKVEAQAPDELVAFLEGLPADVPVAWYSHEDEGAHPGVWMRRGMYRLKHGSFVDPADLSAYAAQYYEADERGRHDAVQIGRSPEGVATPADAIPVATVGELLAAIAQLVPTPEGVEDATAVAGDGEEADEGAMAAVAFAGAPCSSVFPLKYLQPDAAFELHGALTRGWHAQRCVAEFADGERKQLVVM